MSCVSLYPVCNIAICLYCEVFGAVCTAVSSLFRPRSICVYRSKFKFRKQMKLLKLSFTGKMTKSVHILYLSKSKWSNPFTQLLIRQGIQHTLGIIVCRFRLCVNRDIWMRLCRWMQNRYHCMCLLCAWSMKCSQSCPTSKVVCLYDYQGWHDIWVCMHLS